MRVAAAFLYFTCALAVSSARAAEPSIVGDWFEDETYGGQRTIAVGHFKPDGTFSVDFRTCLKKGVIDHTETGQWTYSGGRLQMMTQTNNGLWVSDVEDYQTVSNNGQLWIYKSVAGESFQELGQVTFHDARVEAGSKPPTCDLTS
jgi:hypothetical protein